MTKVLQKLRNFWSKPLANGTSTLSTSRETSLRNYYRLRCRADFITGNPCGCLGGASQWNMESGEIQSKTGLIAGSRASNVLELCKVPARGGAGWEAHEELLLPLQLFYKAESSPKQKVNFWNTLFRCKTDTGIIEWKSNGKYECRFQQDL